MPDWGLFCCLKGLSSSTQRLHLGLVWIGCVNLVTKSGKQIVQDPLRFWLISHACTALESGFRLGEMLWGPGAAHCEESWSSPRKYNFLCTDVLAGVTFGPKNCSNFSVENKKTTTHCHDEEHVGCSFLIFALKEAEMIINSDKIMAPMTKSLALHSKSWQDNKKSHSCFQRRVYHQLRTRFLKK